MEKILIWYVDTEGNTRIQVLEKPKGFFIQTFLRLFGERVGVKTVLEAYTISAVHEIHENNETGGFYTSTTFL